MFENFSEWMNHPLSAAVAGGLVGGGFTCLGLLINISNERRKSSAAEHHEVVAFCQAIATELHCVVGRYMDSVGTSMEQHDRTQPFAYFYPVFEDYFTIFNSNASMVGKIQDRDLRSEMVQVYIIGKALLDTYKLNNQIVVNWQEAQHSADRSGVAQDQLYAQNLFEKMRKMTPVLFSVHKAFSESAYKIITKLNQPTVR